MVTKHVLRSVDMIVGLVMGYELEQHDALLCSKSENPSHLRK